MSINTSTILTLLVVNDDEKGSGSNTTVIIIVSIIAVLICIVFVVIGYVCWKKNRKWIYEFHYLKTYFCIFPDSTSLNEKFKKPDLRLFFDPRNGANNLLSSLKWNSFLYLFLKCRPYFVNYFIKWYGLNIEIFIKYKM